MASLHIFIQSGLEELLDRLHVVKGSPDLFYHLTFVWIIPCIGSVFRPASLFPS